MSMTRDATVAEAVLLLFVGNMRSSEYVVMATEPELTLAIGGMLNRTPCDVEDELDVYCRPAKAPDDIGVI